MAIFTGAAPSAKWDYVNGSSGYTFLVNGADRPQVQTVAAVATRNMGIVPPSVAVTFDADSGTGLTGNYYYYVSWYNEESDTRSSPGPISAVRTVANKTINVNRPEAPPETQITHWIIWRNTDGQTDVFYKVAEVAATTTDYADSTSDDALALAEVMEEDCSRPDPQHPFIAFHQGYFFLYGGRVESTGTIATTNLSANIVGTGTEFRAGHVGQRIVINEEAFTYTIETVTDSTHATITPVYAGTTNGSRSFKIRPFFPSKFQYSRSDHYEEFPLDQAGDVGAFDNDPTTTGMFKVMDAIYFCKEKHLYRLAFTTNPNPVEGDGQMFHVSDGRGSLGPRTVVVRGPNAYIMDRQGFYVFNGGQGTTEIDQAIQPIIFPSHLLAEERINWEVASKFHAVWEPKKKRVMWFVAMDDDTEPHNALCYDPELQRWSGEYYRNAITCSINQPDGNGVERAWCFDEYGRHWALAVDPGLDANPAYTIRGTATAGGAANMTDSTANFGAGGATFRDDQTGRWLHIYEGTGEGQYRRITSHTDTVLTVTPAWGTQPDATSKYRIGDVEMIVKTQVFQMEEPSKVKEGYSLRIFFDPLSPDVSEEMESDGGGWAGISLYRDLSDEPFTEWKNVAKVDGLKIPKSAFTDGEVRVYLDNPDGVVTIPLGGLPAKAWQLQIRYEESFRPCPITGFEFVGAKLPENDWRDR